MKQLDSTNVRILTAIEKFGPRNLLEVSRRTRIPFTSVYTRVRRLESVAGNISVLVPQVSKLGLISIMALTVARPGAEDKVTEALKIPRYWRLIERCEGGFTHHSIHCVPVQYAKGYQQYLREITSRGLASSSTIMMLSDCLSTGINFEYYDPKKKQWKFRWDDWLRAIAKHRATSTIEDPRDYSIHLDHRDLLLIRELESNARKRFVDLSPLLGITLQAVKYRYDRKLAEKGILDTFALDLLPFPREISAFYEILCEFPNRLNMNRFYSYLPELFFTVGRAKTLKRNSLVLWVCILDSQVTHLFEFLSQLCNRRILTSYSAVRLRYDTKEKQTTPIELFNDKTGWAFDEKKCAAQLRKVR